MENDLLFNSLNNIRNNKYCNISFNNVVETTLKLAKNYVFANRSRLSNLCTEKKIMQDLAIDAISSMFIKNGKEKFPICKSFEEWQPEIQNEEDAIYFLSKITACRIEQYINKYLKESDPVFAKILNSLNYLLKKHEYTKLRILGQVFIVKNNEFSINKSVLSYDDLIQIPSSLFEVNDQLFDNLFEYIENYTQMLSAIPLNALATRIKNIQNTTYCNIRKPNIIESLIFVNEIVDNAYLDAELRLTTGYFEKGKISDEDYSLLKNVLYEISRDLINGGSNISLCKYILGNDQSITKEQYQERYQNILEYLYKVMKKKIGMELNNI